METKEPTKEQFEDVIRLVKEPYEWMLADIMRRHNTDGNPGNYSDELKLAIHVKEMLDLV